MLKLGRNPVRLDNGGPNGTSRTLMLGKYLAEAEIPSPPDSVDWYSHVLKWKMLGNDHVGNCTICTIAHLIQPWTKLCTGTAVVLTLRQVMRAYRMVSGYIPGRPRTDRGAHLLDVMNHWRKRGVAGRKIDAFAKIDHNDTTEVKQGVFLFGGIVAGIALPKAVQKATAIGSTWDRPAGTLSGEWLPWSWGGHAVPILGYKDGLFSFVSWNGVYHMTTAFLEAYLEEAYVGYSSADWAHGGTAPNGRLASLLMSDVAAIGA